MNILIRVEEWAWEETDQAQFQIEEHYFDNIDKAKTYVEKKLQGKDWSALHPGMVLDTYIYDKEYVYGTSMMLKRFKAISMEMI